jgi:hypothetical protein
VPWNFALFQFGNHPVGDFLINIPHEITSRRIGRKIVEFIILRKFRIVLPDEFIRLALLRKIPMEIQYLLFRFPDFESEFDSPFANFLHRHFIDVFSHFSYLQVGWFGEFTFRQKETSARPPFPAAQRRFQGEFNNNVTPILPPAAVR